MQTTDSLYLRIRSTPGCRAEYQMTIAGTAYDQSSIVGAPRISGALFSGNGPGIGGAVAREIDLQIYPQGTIPKRAEIRVWFRLVAPDASATDWYPKGVFYIAARHTDRVSGVMTIHGYDAMIKADQPFFTEGDTGEWPRPMRQLVDEIAQRMGVELDSRMEGALNETYMAEFPNDLTMRELLGAVACAHGANWIITDAGKLLLIQFAASRKETGYLVDEYGSAITFGGIRIVV